MIRGLDVGIKREVSAKLRECGVSESLAMSLAETRLADATQFFNGRLSAHQLRGKSLEAVLDDSFVELSGWAADLAASLPGDASASG